MDRRKEESHPREPGAGNQASGDGARANAITSTRADLCLRHRLLRQSEDELLTEDNPSGVGFLPEVTREWEAASRIAADAGIRTVNLRFGLVLSPKGGALAKMLTPFKLGLGGKIGSGKQWWSWIHVDDIVGALHHSLQTDSLSGPVNLVCAPPGAQSGFHPSAFFRAEAPCVVFCPIVRSAHGLWKNGGGRNALEQRPCGTSQTSRERIHISVRRIAAGVGRPGWMTTATKKAGRDPSGHTEQCHAS